MSVQSASRTAPLAAAVVLAGGTGTRLGAAGNKVYLSLGGRPLLAWSLALFRSMPEFGPVVLVVRDGEQELAAPAIAAAGGRIDVVAGGSSRQGSELAAFRHLAPAVAAGRIDAVAVHDAARPLVDRALVREVLAATREWGGAVPGLRRDDLAVAGAGETLSGPAAGLVAVQTPQGFRAAELVAAYEAADAEGFVGTDTASCMARYAPQVPIRWVPGAEDNIKVTYPHDLLVAATLLP